MNAAGIDVSGRKSTVAVLRPFGEVIKLPFDVPHSAEELASLAEQLKSIEGETRVVMEHTGRYYESIAKVLHEAGLYVSAVNPLLIKEYGNNSLRKVKTDKADAMKIAKYALDNWSELRDYTPMDTIRYDLRTMNRQFQLAVKQKTATANNLIALQEQSFPGIRKLFDSPVRSDGTQKWVDFTRDFWHTDCVRSGSLNAFTGRYRKWCKRNRYQFSTEKAAEVYALAKSAVVLVQKTSVTKTLVQAAADRLTAISRSVETYRSEMNKLASQLPEYSVVMEMYGVGESLGPQLMAEIRDYVHRIVGGMTEDELTAMETAIPTYARKIKDKIEALEGAYQEKKFKQWLDAGKIVCRESYTLPPVITPSKATDVIPKSLYEAEADDMNSEERDFIDAVVALDNVKWWHRIIKNKGFLLNGYINHYPDFLMMTNAGRLVVLEYKGGDRDNSNSREKLELGRQWDAHSGENYRYFMVFKNREVNANGTMDRFIEVMRVL